MVVGKFFKNDRILLHEILIQIVSISQWIFTASPTAHNYDTMAFVVNQPPSCNMKIKTVHHTLYSMLLYYCTMELLTVQHSTNTVLTGALFMHNQYASADQ